MRFFRRIMMMAWLYSMSNVSAAADAGLDSTGQEAPPPPPPVFSLLSYHTNYLLPLTVSSEHSQLASEATPDNQSLQPEEVSFQLSFKAPVYRNFFNKNNTLYVAYTQLSFWQAYDSSPFFRETDYQPEVFLENKLELPLMDDWWLSTLNIGSMHQSNGKGGDDERTWNRVYVLANFSHQDWQLSIEPWYVIPDDSMHEHNSDIANYLGHGQIAAAYKREQQSFTLTSYGLENGDHQVTGIATWSFPLIHTFKGYVQAFSGYGQSLLEYDHHINSIGIGVSLGDVL